jgi:hypothetical protein
MIKEKRCFMLVGILIIVLLITACISVNLKPTNGTISSNQETIVQVEEQKEQLLAEEESKGQHQIMKIIQLKY